MQQELTQLKRINQMKSIEQQVSNIMDTDFSNKTDNERKEAINILANYLNSIKSEQGTEFFDKIQIKAFSLIYE